MRKTYKAFFFCSAIQNSAQSLQQAVQDVPHNTFFSMLQILTSII